MALEQLHGADWMLKNQNNQDVIAAAVAANSVVSVIASDAEAITGTSTTLALTPANLRAALKGSAQTISSAALGTVRLIHGSITASHAAISGGTVAGVRGLATLSGVISAGGAYLYGTQGKLAITGTMNHADSRLCALIAQVDTSGGTLTAGQLSGLWVDMLGIAGAGGGQYNAIRVTAAAGIKPNALMYFQGDASFMFDMMAPSGGAQSFVAAAGTGATSAGVSTGGVASKVIAVQLAAGTFYIPLYASNA